MKGRLHDLFIKYQAQISGRGRWNVKLTFLGLRQPVSWGQTPAAQWSYCGFLPLSAFNDQYGCWSPSTGPGNLGTNFQESSIPSVQILTVHILVIQTPEVCSTEHSRCAGRRPQLGLPSCSSLIWLVLYLLTHLQMPSTAKRTLISLKLQWNNVNLWLLSLPSLLLPLLLLLSQCLEMKSSRIRQMFYPHVSS